MNAYHQKYFITMENHLGSSKKKMVYIGSLHDPRAPTCNIQFQTNHADESELTFTQWIIEICVYKPSFLDFHYGSTFIT